jgi:hypothetical protein
MDEADGSRRPMDPVGNELTGESRPIHARTALVCLLLLQVTSSCTSGADTGGAPSASPSASAPAETFPGGGAILSSGAGGLRATFPNGSSTTIGPFLGAEPFPGLQSFPTGELLAWKLTHEDYDYFVMRMDGTHRRHVLRPTTRRIPFGVQVSPDGTKLAYIRATYLGPGRTRYELFVLDLSSGHSVNLGRIGPAGPAADFTYTFAWDTDPRLLLVQSDDRRSIQWIYLRSLTRPKSTYLSVTDRRIATSYARVRPNAGPPSEIRPIGWSPNSNFAGFAVLVSGRDGSDPAIVVLGDGPTRAFAVPGNPTGVELTWAVTGTRFLLASWVDERHGPTDWVLTVGNARTGNEVEIAREPRIRASLLDPDGDVVVYAPNTRHWVFVPVGGCREPRACDERIEMGEVLQAWVA